MSSWHFAVGGGGWRGGGMAGLRLCWRWEASGAAAPPVVQRTGTLALKRGAKKAQCARPQPGPPLSGAEQAFQPQQGGQHGKEGAR